jgi:enediyne biosynthesis protein E4
MHFFNTKKNLLALAALALLMAHCKSDSSGPAVTFSEKKAPADALFQLVKPADSGVNFVNQITETHDDNILTNSYLYNGGGVGILDVNHDGLPDLFFVSTQESCRLYLNEGNLKFRDITETSGIGITEGIKTGVTIADVNADGWDDIYVCRTGLKVDPMRRNLLFINNKNNTFTERANEFGLADAAASNHANFFDADLDGDLDCYVLNYPPDFKTVNSARVTQDASGRQVRITEPDNLLESDHFFRNNGNGTFSEVSREVGIWNRAMGLSATVSDLNADGLPDVVVGNDYIEPDLVYLNQPARPGTFREAAANTFRHTSNHTMGVDIGDVNGDGLLDLVALDMLAEQYPRQKELMSTMLHDRYHTLARLGYGKQQMRNVLQINNGDGTFSEVGCLAGVYQTDWSWAALLQDFDNDGQRDLFITNGYRRDVSNFDYLTFTADSIMRTGGVTPQRFPKIQDYLDLIPQVPLQNYCYRNLGDLRFEDVSTAWGFTPLTYSNGSAYADLDLDGDLDLVINNLDAPASIFQNRARELRKGGNWLQIKVEGSTTNPKAVGAKARVQAGGQVFVSELQPVRGFFSSVDPVLHFGLGAAQVADQIDLEYPDGRTITLTQVPVNQRITTQHADATPGRMPALALPAAWLKTVAAPDFVHVGAAAADFSLERLLPWRVSAPGPLISVADVNADGLDDCFVGNGPNASAALFLQLPSGGFRVSSAATWAADAACDDVGSAFFDADGDGALDLVVASGGNTAPLGSRTYAIRLYRNDGKGNFAKIESALPPIFESIHAVSTHDVDGDGDVDIVLGGGVTPGSYPAVPRSFVLKNNSQAGAIAFTEATAQLAPDLSRAGMVRSMVWADLDGDQQAELVVSGEWMPLMVFRKSGGKLVLDTARFGLEASNGFWRSLVAADLDGDGDLDLVAGNLGLNTRYRAAADAPLRMFARDFDGNGSMDPIMTQTENGRDVPVAMRDILLKQLPPLKKKMVRYAQYARLGFEDLFDEGPNSDVLRLHCNTLASCVFLNEKGKMVAHPLPNAAQVAPICGIALTDVDGDGDVDLLTVGNDYGQQVETGPLDASNGCVLLNDGKGQFVATPARRSGLWANRDARDIRIVRGAGQRRTVLVANHADGLQMFSLE